MELITIIVGTTIIIGGLWFMRSVILYLEKELSKQKDIIQEQADEIEYLKLIIIQEQADEIEYLNYIIALKKYGKVVSCQSWIIERLIKEYPDSINFQYNGIDNYWISERK